MKAGYSLTAADDDAMLERSRANSHGLCIQSCLFARMTRRWQLIGSHSCALARRAPT